MKILKLTLLLALLASLSACAVVTTAAVVGSVAVSATSTVVGITYDAGKAVANGTIAASEYAYDAAVSSHRASSPMQSAVASSTSVAVTPLHD